MRIGVLGTGVVGKTIASRLIVLGHSVTMGSRTADNPEAVAWAAKSGPSARAGTFADAAAFGELLVNATAGSGALAALAAAGDENLRGKVLLDISNPLDFSHGMPPTLSVANTDSLGEQIQRAHPEAKVVKTLNTMNCELQVDPTRVPGSHNVFMSGDDAEAKAMVAGLLHLMGWPRNDIIDLGGIATARGAEMILPLWLELMGALGTPMFNFKIVR
jgi:8-hydroxy-5-deazaflavin:NADPH oxidoreductase